MYGLAMNKYISKHSNQHLNEKEESSLLNLNIELCTAVKI